jgi:hypothetical protein
MFNPAATSFFSFFSGTSPMLPRPAQLMRRMAFANAWVKLVDYERRRAELGRRLRGHLAEVVAVGWNRAPRRG